MATVRSAHRNLVPRGLAIAPLLLALGTFAPAALADPQPSHDDVAYGDIPQATFGASAAPAASESAPASYDDATYGAVPRDAFALELGTPEEPIALDGHDDVTYPSAVPGRSAEAAIATSPVREGGEVRTSDDARNAASHAEASH